MDKIKYPDWENYFSQEEFDNLTSINANAIDRLLNVMKKVNTSYNFKDWERTVKIVPLYSLETERDVFMENIEKSFLEFIEGALSKYGLNINYNTEASSNKEQILFIKENLKLFPPSLKKEIMDIFSSYPKLLEKQERKTIGYMRVSNRFYDWITCSTSKYFSSCANFKSQGLAKNNALFYYLAKHHYVVKVFDTEEDAIKNDNNFTDRVIVTDDGKSSQAIHRLYGSNLRQKISSSINIVKETIGLNLNFNVTEAKVPLSISHPIGVPNLYIDIAKGNYNSYVYSDSRIDVETVIKNSFRESISLLTDNTNY